MKNIKFTLQATSSKGKARAGLIESSRGVTVQTPVFMPVGTQATVKGHRPEGLWDIGSRVLLANTYHLMQRPGLEVFKKLGGIHKFMNWKGLVLTDSGGFQVFSLSEFCKVSDEGALFRSYKDGSKILLSPETSIGAQVNIGSDIMMVMDQCIRSTVSKTEAGDAMNRTHLWAERSLKAKIECGTNQSLFGIIQGACFKDLRKQSAQYLTQLDFDGFAVGGLAVGETKSERQDFTDFSTDFLPIDKPRYLMGVGTPEDLLDAIYRGIDMFDCILPTALAQQGVAYTSQGRVRINRGAYEFSERALDPRCDCYTCTGFSCAYLNHLIKANELLGWQLIGIHNLTFYHKLMREAREAILSDRYEEFYKSKVSELTQPDPDFPIEVQEAKRKSYEKDLVRGDYEVFLSEGKSATIRHKVSGEMMHSSNDPTEESRKLYVEQSKIIEKLIAARGEKITVWDVGLGSGFNVMALIREVEKKRDLIGDFNLEIYSFERDLDAFNICVDHPKIFHHLRHRAPFTIISKKYWESESKDIQWTLIHDDFKTAFINAPKPDIVFYDPFSSKVNQDLWSYGFFSKLHTHFLGKPVALYTYTNATPIRSGLLLAGFYVGAGVSTGRKTETTIATNSLKLISESELLSARWIDRWKRSHSRVPSDVVYSQEFESKILSHSQFTGLI